jgi:hypothetical protein
MLHSSNTVKVPFKVSFRSSEFEHSTEENVKLGKLNTELLT